MSFEIILEMLFNDINFYFHHYLQSNPPFVMINGIITYFLRLGACLNLNDIYVNVDYKIFYIEFDMILSEGRSKHALILLVSGGSH